MSDAAARNAFISEELRKLITLMKSQGSELTPEEFRAHEQSAWSHIRHHRYLSTNSHAVRRALEALVDRFHCESMAVFGDTLRHLYTIFIELPKWKEEHTEVDLQWSILDFLLALAIEPIQNVRRNRLEMDEKRLAMLKAVEVTPSSVDKLADTNWKEYADSDESVKDIPGSFYGNSVETLETLSDWSDDTGSEESNEQASNTENTTTSPRNHSSNNLAVMPFNPPSSTVRQPLSLCLTNVEQDKSFWCKLPKMMPLHPPSLFSQYKKYSSEKELVPRLIHSHWWRNDIKIFAQPQSSSPLDNFAIAYVEYLNKKSLGMLRYPLPNTTTEKCLLREINFMFFKPTNCCFFVVDAKQQKIKTRHNVTICTVTVDTLKGVLDNELIPALNAMMHISRIISDYNSCKSADKEDELLVTTGTLECFAIALRDLIQPIEQRLIDYDLKVTNNDGFTSLMSFLWYMKKDFEMLKLLQHLANTCMINSAPPHLMSAYLLSQLYANTKLFQPHQKLATALLLFSFKRYCGIMDAWWQRALLEDWQNEFIVERSSQNECDSSWGAIKERGLPPTNTSEQNVRIYEFLKKCPFYRLLLDHAIESGETQDLLASVNRLGNMLYTTKWSDYDSLHAELTARVFTDMGIYCGGASELKKFEPDMQLVQSRQDMIEYDRRLMESCTIINDQDILSLITGHVNDDYAEKANIDDKPLPPHSEVCQILSALEQCSQLQLIYYLPRGLNNILRDRRSHANAFAMQYYREDLHLGDHVRFLRHIMLLEADYILYPFYTQLFCNIESGEEWANNSLLTMELYDIIMPRYPDMAGQLHVELISQVRAKSSKIYEALDAIELVYDMPIALQKILTPSMMSTYNSIWRLMLKVKWAAWKLENLRFIRRSDPYAALDLLGLTVRRLEILRFWLNYLINSLHTHLCTHVMQATGEQFERQLLECATIGKLYSLHNEYLELLAKHCLLTDDFVKFRVALEQLLHLIFVLDMEWASCRRYVDQSHALSLDLSCDQDNDDQDNGLEYLALNQVVEIENTYIKCHQTLAEILQNLVHKQEHGFLSALEVVFNTSVPY